MVSLTGGDITAYGREALIAVAWLVVVFIAASRAYRLGRVAKDHSAQQESFETSLKKDSAAIFSASAIVG